MRLADISFNKKIFILLLFPLLGFLSVGISALLSSTATNTEMKKLSRYTQLSAVYSELVHELQIERAMTAGFLGSKGEKFFDILPNQREKTSQKAEKRINYFKENNFTNKEVISLNEKINQHLIKLTSIRNNVDKLSIPTAEAIAFYSETNEVLLSVSAIIAKISTNADITREIVAYGDFLDGKEKAGIERAVLTSTFAFSKFNLGMYDKFIKLVSEQETYFAHFISLTNAENINFYVQKQNEPSVKEVTKLRKIARDNAISGQFNVDPTYWFEQSTKRIGVLKDIEDKVSESLLALTQRIQDNAFNSVIYSAVSLLVILLLVAIIGFYIIKELREKVADLTYVMSKVSNDNDLTARAKFTSKAELGQISTALNITLEKFSSAINEISTSSTALATAAEETSQTCEHNSRALIEQQDEIAQIATAIEELSATVKEVATNTQLTSDSAKEADKQAQDGTIVVQESHLCISKLSNEINDLAKRISSLHESSNNITSVVDVIKSVAEQTNLLALNAAIEAARAGEQGRGFAVVADEVRTLAQRTQQSTSEIESFISALQADANSAFSVIETSQQMAKSAVDSSENVEQTLTAITHSIGQIFTMTEQVAVAVEEQAMVTQDVSKNVVTIEHKSMESTAASTQIAATAKEQAILAVRLQDISTTFKVS